MQQKDKNAFLETLERHVQSVPQFHGYNKPEDVFPRLKEALMDSKNAHEFMVYVNNVLYEGPYAYNKPYYNTQNHTQEERLQAYAEYDKWIQAEHQWSKKLQEEYIKHFGKVRTDEEALDSIATFWSDRIFCKVVQDAGRDESSVMFNMMSSIAKADVMYEITPAMKDKAYALLKEYYKEQLDKEHKGQQSGYLAVDYSPCQALYDILQKAGVPERTIALICPVKTSARIESLDNTILAMDGYGNWKHL